jgi:hypothetical protein
MAQEDIMRHTFKASFEQQGDAQHLMEELSAAGFTGVELALSGATHAGPFTHRRPAVTLTVDAESDAQRALGIMERCKPARLQDDPAGDDAEADAEADAAPAQAGRPMRAYPPGAEPGALQFHRIDDGRYFGTQNAAAPPAGNTFQETMGTAAHWIDPDEYTIRQTAAALWPDIDVGDNDRERTAFRFGRILRMDDRYRNRSWDEAEAALKLEWASFAEVSCAWDDAKASVRRGWDRTTPEIDDDTHYRSHWTTNSVHGSDATATMADDQAHGQAHHGMSAWHKVKEALRHGWARGKS